jgi:endoglucanase
MNTKLLQRLTEAHGVSGQEDAIREIVRQELKDICEISVDVMGNIHCVKRATHKPKKGEAKKLWIGAHMDEIGFMVKFIEEKGFIRLQPLGGWDPRNLASQRVLVHTSDGPLHGVMMLSSKPRHMLTPDEMNKAPQIENYFVDTGLSGDDAKARIRLGDMVTMDRTFMQMGDLCTCKCMDDRVAVFVMIEALKAVKDHEVDVYAVATVQEEVGLRGAATSGWSVKPDIAVAVDVTIANDFPGMGDADAISKLGEGAAIKIMDGSLICHPKMVAHFRALAEKKKIKHQMEILPFGGTDAGGVQRLHGGIPSFTLSVPCRYVHTVNETVHKDDVQASVDLLKAYIEDAHKGDYSYK